MKKYLLTLLVSLVSVTSFAQEEVQVNPFDGSAELIACYGDEVSIESGIGLDLNGGIVAGLLLSIDPNTDLVDGGSIIDLSAVSKDDSTIKADGVLVELDSMSYVLEASRAPVDFSYVDEANNSVSLATYVGSITISGDAISDVINVTCVIQPVL